MPAALSDTDRSDFRKQILVAVAGIAVGALSTIFTKSIESEFAYQASLKVVQYDDKCEDITSNKSAPFITRCTITVEAKGRKSIKRIGLKVVAYPNPADPAKTLPIVSMGQFSNSPAFAPQATEPYLPDFQNIPNVRAIILARLIEPQSFTWSVDVSSSYAIDEKRVIRTITIDDEDARAVDGSSWSWTRWLSVVFVILIGLLIVSGIFLLALWAFRHKGAPIPVEAPKEIK
jgi:hypothetical protein